MTIPTDPLAEPSTPDEALLERLEHDIITGQQASLARTDLMVRMARSGISKHTMLARINRVRSIRNAKPLTYFAVAQAIKRATSK